MIKEGSLLAKVAGGIAMASLISVSAFGLRIYKAEDNLVTKDQLREAQSEQFLFNEDHYVHKDVSDVQFEAIKDQLDRMEEKIDRLEAEQ